MKCYSKFSDAEQSMILEQFNKVGTYDAQRLYPSSLMSISDVQRVGAQGRGGKRVTRVLTKTLRQHVIKYYINIGGRHQLVCKQWFSSSHGLSANNSVLRQISQQLQETGVAKKDLRGKHKSST